MNNELGEGLKGGCNGAIQVIFQHFPGCPEEDKEKPQSE
jgi:hypothetical protein